MSDKSVDQFIHDLVNSPQEMHLFPTSWDMVEEKFCAEEDQDQPESEEE